MKPYTTKIWDSWMSKKRIYVVNESSTEIEKRDYYNKGGENKTDECNVVPRRYIIVLLGFLSFVILNAQRVNMVIALVAMTNTTGKVLATGQECSATAAHNVSRSSVNRGTFNWNPEIQSYIVGSSFLGFVLTQTPGGRLAETVGAKQILLFSLFCASLCNLLSPLAATWNTYLLIAAQFVKGMAQGFIQPSISCLMVRWYPQPERSFMSSLTFSGFPVGALFGGITSGVLCDTDFLGGWPSVFYVFGFFGILLVLLLNFYVHNTPEENPNIQDTELKYILCNQETRRRAEGAEIPWLQILRSIPTWGLLAGMCGQYWMTYYFISVHPSYLATVLNFSVMQSGLLSSLPYILQIFVTWFSSYGSDWFIRKNFASTDSARKFCNTLSCLGFSLSLLGVAYAGCNPVLNTVCFFVAVGSIGLGFPGSLTVPMDMTSNFTGTLMGFSSTVGSTTGFIIPVVVGRLLNDQQTLRQWRKVFVLSASLVLTSGILFHIFGAARLQDWDSNDEKSQREKEQKPADCANPVIITPKN